MNPLTNVCPCAINEGVMIKRLRNELNMFRSLRLRYFTWHLPDFWTFHVWGRFLSLFGITKQCQFCTRYLLLDDLTKTTSDTGPFDPDGIPTWDGGWMCVHCKECGD